MQFAPWVDRADTAMLYRGNQLKRQKFFINCDEDEKIPVYRYPGAQWQTLKHYQSLKSVKNMPLLCELLDRVKKDVTFNGLPVRFNHVIGTLYSKETDEIGAHSDKVRDIELGTPILSLSFLDAREFILARTAGNEADGDEDVVEVLRAGDLFALGPQTNSCMTHAVPSIAKETVIKRPVDPTVPCGKRFGPRISLVLRQIATVVDQKTLEERQRIARKSKTRRDALKAARVRSSGSAAGRAAEACDNVRKQRAGLAWGLLVHEARCRQSSSENKCSVRYWKRLSSFWTLKIAFIQMKNCIHVLVTQNVFDQMW